MLRVSRNMWLTSGIERLVFAFDLNLKEWEVRDGKAFLSLEPCFTTIIVNHSGKIRNYPLVGSGLPLFTPVLIPPRRFQGNPYTGIHDVIAPSHRESGSSFLVLGPRYWREMLFLSSLLPDSGTTVPQSPLINHFLSTYYMPCSMLNNTHTNNRRLKLHEFSLSRYQRLMKEAYKEIMAHNGA